MVAVILLSLVAIQQISIADNPENIVTAPSTSIISNINEKISNSNDLEKRKAEQTDYEFSSKIMRIKFFKGAKIDSQGQKVSIIKDTGDKKLCYFRYGYQSTGKPIIITSCVLGKEKTFYCKKFWAHKVTGWYYPSLDNAYGHCIMAIGYFE